MVSRIKYRTLRICLTNACNIRCIYCCGEGYKSNYSILNRDNVYNLVSIAYDVLGISRVKYTGGEPLLFGELSSAIMKVNGEYGDKIHQSVVTNGVEHDLFKKIVTDNRNLEITLSVPCLNTTTFNKLNRSKVENLHAIKRSLDFMIETERAFKINYVLLKGVNDSQENLESLFSKVVETDCSLRFLEPIQNTVNNLADRFLVDRTEFINTLKNSFKFHESLSTRSHTQLQNDRITVKYIHSFCSTNCIKCPDDKSSLWVTSEGKVSSCCYGNLPSKENFIEKWSRTDIRQVINKYK